MSYSKQQFHNNALTIYHKLLLVRGPAPKKYKGELFIGIWNHNHKVYMSLVEALGVALGRLDEVTGSAQVSLGMNIISILIQVRKVYKELYPRNGQHKVVSRLMRMMIQYYRRWRVEV